MAEMLSYEDVKTATEHLASVDFSLDRVAGALERIADCLEKNS